MPSTQTQPDSTLADASNASASSDEIYLPNQQVSLNLVLADIKEFLEQARSQVIQAVQAKLRPEYEELSQQYSRSNEQLKQLIAEGASGIHRKYQEFSDFTSTVKFLKSISVLISNELHQALSSSAEESLVSPGDIGDLLEMFSGQMHRQQEIQRLRVQTEANSDQLREVFDELQQHRHCSAARLRNLSRKILMEAERTTLSVMDYLHPYSLLLTEVEQQKKYGYQYAVSTGMMTATIIAQSMAVFPQLDRIAEPLTMAALLDDVGFILLENRFGYSPVQLRETQLEEYQRHPQYSAALAAGLRGAGVQLPQLIARHHERLDGTGYPLQLQKSRLRKEHQLLAVAAAISDAIHRPLVEISADSSVSDLRSSEAVSQLCQEAKYGEWDQSLMMLLLERLGYQIQTDEGLHGHAPPFQYTRFKDHTLRVDSAHKILSTNLPHHKSIAKSSGDNKFEAGKFI